MAPRSPIQCFDSLKPYSTRAITPECFWVVKSIARFFRRSTSGKQPGALRKALTAAEKYQHHLKSNACWPASSGRGRLRRAQLLTRFKSSMEVSTKPGERSCKWMITGQIEAQDFCDCPRCRPGREHCQGAEAHQYAGVDGGRRHPVGAAADSEPGTGHRVRPRRRTGGSDPAIDPVAEEDSEGESEVAKCSPTNSFQFTFLL